MIAAHFVAAISVSQTGITDRSVEPDITHLANNPFQGCQALKLAMLRVLQNGIGRVDWIGRPCSF